MKIFSYFVAFLENINFILLREARHIMKQFSANKTTFLPLINKNIKEIALQKYASKASKSQGAKKEKLIS